jgi:uncharacterized membrane protein (DUF2068 family)
MHRNTPHISAPAEIGIRFIIAFKILKGLLLISTGVGALSLLHKDAAEHVAGWIATLRVDPDNHYVHSIIAKAGLLDNRKLEEVGVGTFFYATLLLTEGLGLYWRKRWAEYFTVIVTGSFIPLETYEIVERLSVMKFLVLAINVAVVWYLIRRIKRGAKEPSGV